MKYRYSSVKRAIEALLFVAVLALGWRYPCLAYCLLLNVAVGHVARGIRSEAGTGKAVEEHETAVDEP